LIFPKLECVQQNTELVGTKTCVTTDLIWMF